MKIEASPFAEKRLARSMLAALLAVFVPASVLAGPLRYCFGDDGHRDIAFVHVQGEDHRSLSDASAAANSAIVDHGSGEGCEDSELLAAATKPLGARKSPARPKDVCGLPAAFQSLLSCNSLSLARDEQFRRCWTDDAPDPHLAALRTIVLLN